MCFQQVVILCDLPLQKVQIRNNSKPCLKKYNENQSLSYEYFTCKWLNFIRNLFIRNVHACVARWKRENMYVLKVQHSSLFNRIPNGAGGGKEVGLRLHSTPPPSRKMLVPTYNRRDKFRIKKTIRWNAWSSGWNSCNLSQYNTNRFSTEARHVTLRSGWPRKLWAFHFAWL